MPAQSLEQLGITSVEAHTILAHVVERRRDMVVVHSDWHGERHVNVRSLPFIEGDIVSEAHAYSLYLPMLEDLVELSKRGKLIGSLEIARTSQLSRHA